MSFSGLALKAPTMTTAPSVVSNTPVSGKAPQFRCLPRCSHIAASCICMASVDSNSDTETDCPLPVLPRCKSASRIACTRCMPAV